VEKLGHMFIQVFFTADLSSSIRYAVESKVTEEKERNRKESPVRISVIVPTYSRPHDLPDLLNSLLNQSVRPLEIIVVDDTPSPCIKNLCADYETRCNNAKIILRYVKNPRERSSAIARNFGAKIAKGDLLMFLDDDVVIPSDYIEKVRETFDTCPKALGVAGWLLPSQIPTGSIRYFSATALRRLFLLAHDSRNSMKLMEIPISLTKITNVSYASGSNLTVKRSVFEEFQFDETLKDYAYMEDVLFTASIHKKYPKGLVMTPYAKAVHKISREVRLEGVTLRRRTMQNIKYILTKLFGPKGLLMFGWQETGLLILISLAKIRRWKIVIVA
jgi:GT2 family glycosyltransferase